MIIDLMQSAHAAPRCGAKSKRTGKSCRAPSVRGCMVPAGVDRQDRVMGAIATAAEPSRCKM